MGSQARGLKFHQNNSKNRNGINKRTVKNDQLVHVRFSYNKFYFYFSFSSSYPLKGLRRNSFIHSPIHIVCIIENIRNNRAQNIKKVCLIIPWEF